VTESRDTLVLTMPDDWHVHFRNGDLMRAVVPHTATYFGRALVMPNTNPAIKTAKDLVDYRNQIDAVLRLHPVKHFQPLFTIKLTGSTTRKTIREAAAVGCIAAKLYPIGATTNSEDGVEFPNGILKLIEDGVFEEMALKNMVLCIHGEDPRAEVLDREGETTRYIQNILQVPDIKIVVEHVTTTEMATFVANSDPNRVAATVTAHHLYLTLDDLIGGMLQPHYFCKPVVKPKINRESLWHYVVNCNNFFFGSDSAPHTVQHKENDCCAAGVFTAPILLPLLVKMFEERGLFNYLGDFLSVRGANFYGLPPSDREILLEKHDEPQEFYLQRVGGCRVMPLRDGDHLFWRIVG